MPTEKIAIKEVLPEWFSLGNSVLQSHMTDNLFPKNFTTVSGKRFFAENATAYDVADFTGKNALIACGFNVVNPQTAAADTQFATPKANYGLLLGDSAYADLSDPMNTSKWFSSNIYNLCNVADIILLDFEHFGYGSTDITNKLAEFSAGCLARGTKLGIWANSLINCNSLSVGGVTDTTSANFFVSKYTNPSSLLNQAYYSNMHINNSFDYHRKNMDGAELYLMHYHHEISKIARPTILSLPSLWITVETTDGWPKMEMDIIKPNGQVKAMGIKKTAPANCTYGDAIWCIALMDGFHHFETGRLQTDDRAFAHNEFIDPDTNIQKVTVRGVPNVQKAFTGKYFGFYNYIHLALWQLGRGEYKSIIENSNNWIMPNYNVTNKANQFRTGNFRMTPFAHLNKEPIVRIKYNTAGTKVMFIAQNPYNITLDIVKISDPNNNAWESTIELQTGWPTFGIIDLT